MNTAAGENIGSKIEKTYLAEMVTQKKPVSVYLKNSIRLKGVLTDYDDNVVFLKDTQSTQMIYKNLISTIAPQEFF